MAATALACVHGQPGGLPPPSVYGAQRDCGDTSAAEVTTDTSTPIRGARNLAERLQGCGGIHAGGLQQVEGRRPDLSDKRTGLQVVALLEHGHRLARGPKRELADVEWVV